VLYGGAPHVPHLLLALLCAVVGTITGRRLGQVYPLRRMLGRLGWAARTPPPARRE